MLGFDIDSASSGEEFEVDLETSTLRTRSSEYRQMKCGEAVKDVVAVEAEESGGSSDDETSESGDDDESVGSDDGGSEPDIDDDEALLPANQREAAQQLEAAQARAQDQACIAELTARFITAPARQVF